MDVAEDDYESDPEQRKLSLNMRRRTAASDDEDEENYAGIDPRVSDYESDEQGAAAEYDDDEIDLEEVEVEEDEEVAEHGGRGGRSAEVPVVGEDLADGVIEKCNVDQIGENVNGSEGGEGQGQEEKKENEPFAVPTAGAFYMHDDRFRGSVGGRNRRTLGGKKLWESRDDRKWGHDKFEEMTLLERPYNDGRRVSRARNQARGRNQGQDREYLHGNRPKPQDNNYQNSGPKIVRGKGPRRYRPVTKNDIEAPANNNRRPSKSMEKASRASTGRSSAATSTSESAQIPSRENAFASSLNSASLPFYPSGSSNQEINSAQKKDAQINNMQRKSVSDSLGMEKHPNKLPPPTSGPLFINPTQPLQARNKGRGQRAYQPVPPHHQANRIPSPNQVHAFQRTPVQNRSVSGSQASSPTKVAGPIHLLESTELASPLESYNSKMALVGKGKGGIKCNGMSSFPYGGNPTFLPVMQFAGQHPGGIGVPAVGMAFPGYVSQPNGMGNSEMTWLPVLAAAARSLGASGALGAAYGSPYITLDGAYHAQTSASSKDSNINEPDNKVKPSQRSDLTNDEFGQRQNKARRYTEMKFDQ